MLSLPLYILTNINNNTKLIHHYVNNYISYLYNISSVAYKKNGNRKNSTRDLSP